jgi:hypothetical protein
MVDLHLQSGNANDATSLIREEMERKRARHQRLQFVNILGK